jgi:hypothetical protein
MHKSGVADVASPDRQNAIALKARCENGKKLGEGNEDRSPPTQT